MAENNHFLKSLGFLSQDRVVIFHADDVGMCQASVDAISDLFSFGLLSSASTMVPCSWFPALAAYTRQHPTIDLGVHVTLTSEYDSYRWGPITLHASMIDAEGYFYRTSEEAQAHANPDAVEAEIRVQIQRALDAGIDVTHIDSHMGTVFHPRLIGLYIRAAVDFKLPAFMPNLNETKLRQRGLPDEVVQQFLTLLADLSSQGYPLVDHHVSLPLEEVAAEGRVEQIKQVIQKLQPGLTHLIVHPARDTPELRAIAPTTWHARSQDYAAFMSEDLRGFIAKCGVHVIGYRQLKDYLRG